MCIPWREIVESIISILQAHATPNTIPNYLQLGVENAASFSQTGTLTSRIINGISSTFHRTCEDISTITRMQQQEHFMC